MDKILLVEDNDLILEMLSERLRGRGYQVVGARDGVQAVALAESEQPNLILMDLALPELDGWSATERIRRHPDIGTIPIIALTAYTTGEERDRSLQAGCDDFEPKPIQFERLLEKIQFWIDLKKNS